MWDFIFRATSLSELDIHQGFKFRANFLKKVSENVKFHISRHFLEWARFSSGFRISRQFFKRGYLKFWVFEFSWFRWNFKFRANFSNMLLEIWAIEFILNFHGNLKFQTCFRITSFLWIFKFRAKFKFKLDCDRVFKFRANFQNTLFRNCEPLNFQHFTWISNFAPIFSMPQKLTMNFIRKLWKLKFFFSSLRSVKCLRNF